MQTNFCKIIFFSLFAFTTLTISACSNEQEEKKNKIIIEENIKKQQQEEADKAILSGNPPKFKKDTNFGGFGD